MSMTWIEIAGLIGVVLVVSTGKIFNPLRDFLQSFEHPFNPSRWVADLISCSMCSGVWVGAVWGLTHSWSWSEIVLFSGLLSVLSFMANDLLGLIGILTLRVSRGMVGQHAAMQGQSGAVALAGARARARKPPPRQVAPGDDISEEEADALLDQEEEHADLLAMPAKPDEAA